MSVSTLNRALRIMGCDTGPGGDHCAQELTLDRVDLLNEEGVSSSKLPTRFCTLHTKQIPLTDPLVQSDYVGVVDLDIGASKSDICAIRGRFAFLDGLR
jgi:hypothetical protein